jgi:hypothetical protein
MKQISVFDSQEIGGRTVEPLCSPVDLNNISTSVAAATNLIWFAMNIALAQNDKQEANRLARMVEAILVIECEGSDEDDLDASLERIIEAFEETGHKMELEDDEDEEDSN